VGGPVELVRSGGRVDRVANRDLVADDEDPPLRPREQPLVRLRVPPCRVVQALAARESVRPRVLALPGPVVVDRAPLELADVDVVEERLHLERHRASLERDPRRRQRAAEARVYAEPERDPGQLDGETCRLRLALRGQTGRHGGVAVHEVPHVELRLAVPDEDEEAHGASLCL
jgi:hypothetical protein